jgi:hypothetical protein
MAKRQYNFRLEESLMADVAAVVEPRKMTAYVEQALREKLRRTRRAERKAETHA